MVLWARSYMVQLVGCPGTVVHNTGKVAFAEPTLLWSLISLSRGLIG